MTELDLRVDEIDWFAGLADLLGGETAWQDFALCAQTDPDAFFPEKGGSVREAKRICGLCEVRDDCLEYALAHNEKFGIWGGLSERERGKLKKAEAAEAAEAAGEAPPAANKGGRPTRHGMCARGLHDMSPGSPNVGFNSSTGGRYCRACDRERSRKHAAA